MGDCLTISHMSIALSAWWMGEFMCTRHYWSGWCVGVSPVWPKVYGDLPPQKSQFETPKNQKIFSLVDCSGYNPGVSGEHSTILFSWVSACGWNEATLHDTACITIWVHGKKWGWLGIELGIVCKYYLPRPIIIKFVWYNCRRRIFLNKKNWNIYYTKFNCQAHGNVE